MVDNKSSSKANALGLSNVGGVFVVLLAGMGIATVVAVVEFVWKSRKLASEEHVSCPLLFILCRLCRASIIKLYILHNCFVFKY